MGSTYPGEIAGLNFFGGSSILLASVGWNVRAWA